ncbi:MAG: hypothetical protein M1517_07820 [Deltaproteobacteria bacterium]|nr:hypothetical protein [Deltaproteobacteria bacterium]
MRDGRDHLLEDGVPDKGVTREYRGQRYGLTGGTKMVAWLAGLILAGIYIASSTGCATAPIQTTLIMKPEIPLNDMSASAPQLKAGKKYHKIIVLPPSGTARAEFEPTVALFEREFLRRGVTVISGAITGRVVFGAVQQGEKKEATGEQLSDIERALIMAKQTGADAILQIGNFDWKQNVAGRFFVYNQYTNTFQEVSQSRYGDWHGMGEWYAGDQIEFIGRLIDVESGQVMASFDIICNSSWNLPSPYQATFEILQNENSQPYLQSISENYPYNTGNFWMTAAHKSRERVIERVVQIITGK